MKNKEKNAINVVKNKVSLIAIILAIITVIIVAVFIQTKKEYNSNQISKENLRAKNYAEFVDGDEVVYKDGTQGTENAEVIDNVKFSSFFLRDIDGDGYAEKLKGTCKEIGKEDTLYMEIIVQTAGYLKNGKIEIDGKNFYMQTALPKDNELKANYIGNNIKTIEFENLNNGTQKLLTGIVRSGDYTYGSQKTAAIGNNINNYSRQDNKIVLTGIYVDENGTETRISKEIDLETDWYGETKAAIYSGKGFSNGSQTYNDIENRINEENGTIKANFFVNTTETKQVLNLYSTHLEGTIPELNGFAPISVALKNGSGEFSYDEVTRKFTVIKNAITNEEGNITSIVQNKNNYEFEVVYPLEAYQSIGTETITLKIPVSVYYEGYNNSNNEFINPFKSNIANTTIVANYEFARGTETSIDVKVGKYIYSPYSHYVISKQKPLKLYNGQSSEETDDTYLVTWSVYTGSNGEGSKVTLKENKNGENTNIDKFIKTDSSEEGMEDVVSNVGIYFSGADKFLKEDGEIKVYDDESDELLVTFTKNDWNNYNANNPYKYNLPVKHIKVVTSEVNKEESLYVYNIKELDDDKITEKYVKDEFDNLQYIKTNLVGYMSETYIASKVHQAKYEAPYSIAEISLSKNIISTQVTEKNMKINIKTVANESLNQIKWTNGSFIVKLPEEILDIQINSVSVNNSNVEIEGYELVENDGVKYIKINTLNENPETYTVTINANITSDPRVATTSKQIELYASNEEIGEYYYNSEDIYDVNDNLNIEELINKTATSISLIAPNSLLTNQTISGYDVEGNIIISPQVLDLKPIYGEDDREKQTVKIGVQMRNNYSSTINDVMVLGKIPFEGNKYAISNVDLSSEFSTTMKPFELSDGTLSGIEIPQELQGKVTIYYSENENPNKNISDESNGWKTSENVEDWTGIKTYLIDFEKTIIEQGAEYTFNYTIEIPFGVEFNKISYSHHGIYFSLDTPEGKYKTQTEPNKIGIRIADKYNLVLTKFQKNKDKLVSGATYRVNKLDEHGEVEESQTATTNADGLFEMANLYAEKVYEIKEIKSPEDYELNEDVIKIIGHVNRNSGEISIEKLEGTTRDDVQVIKNEGEDYKVKVSVEDEIYIKLKIQKYEKDTNIPLKFASYLLYADGNAGSSKNVITNENGMAVITKLKSNITYILKEIRAPKGYYLPDEKIIFKIEELNDRYEIRIIEGNVKNSQLIGNELLEEVIFELENEKIETYNLNINKKEKGTTNIIAGAKFNLYKENKKIGTYTTDEYGNVTIDNLYMFDNKKNIDQTYILKEICAPEGYVVLPEIRLYAFKTENGLKLNTDSNIEYTVENDSINIILEDNPVFKIIKKDIETGEALPNTKFSIYNVDEGRKEPACSSNGDILGEKEIIDGEEHYVLKTDEHGEISAKLKEGFYLAEEVEAVNAKYEINNIKKYFGIGKSNIDESTYDINMSKQTIGNVCISKIVETTNNTYIAIGNVSNSDINIDSVIYSNPKAFIVEYDLLGNYIWSTEIPFSLYAISNSNDGGFVIAGSFTSSIEINDREYTSKGAEDSIVIKYNAEKEIEWINTAWGNGYEDINSMAVLDDGTTVLVGNSYSKKFGVDNIEYEVSDSYYGNGYIIAFSAIGEGKWVKAFDGNYEDTADDVIKTSDGGCIVGGYYYSNSLTIDDITIGNRGNGYELYGDSVFAKFNSNGEIQWLKNLKTKYVNGATKLKRISETSDGGYLVAGANTGNLIVENIDIRNYGTDYCNAHHQKIGYDGFVIKYNSLFEVEWATAIGGDKDDRVICAKETSDGGTLIIGYISNDKGYCNGITLNGASNGFNYIIKLDSMCNVEWKKEFNNANLVDILSSSNSDMLIGGSFSGNIELNNKIYSLQTLMTEKNGMILFFNNKVIIPEETTINIFNKTKELKIITEVEEVDGTKGGTISGENSDFYEVVKYGNSSTKEIKMIPKTDYRLLKITINGENQKFKVDEDGTYVLPVINDVKEDIHIIATFVKVSNIFTINKADNEDGKGLEDVEFNITKLNMLSQYAFPDLNQMNRQYFKPNYMIGGKNQNTNSKTFSGLEFTKANSYIDITKATDQDGRYHIEIDAEMSAYPNNDFGWLSLSSDSPNNNKNSGTITILTGEVERKTYISPPFELNDSSSTYFLNIGYEKNGSYSLNKDAFIIYRIVLVKENENGTTEEIEITQRIKQNNQYDFKFQDDKYIPTNSNSSRYYKENTIANGFMQIYPSYNKKNIILIAASISSGIEDDYAYITISKNRPSVLEEGEEIIASKKYSGIDNNKVFIFDDIEAVGQTNYFLNFGYKNGIIVDGSDDSFIINSIQIYEKAEDSFDMVTDENGRIITNLSKGFYSIKEVKAPEDYILDNQIFIVDTNNKNEIKITNEKLKRIIVHHYLKDEDGNYTTQSIAEDEIVQGKKEEKYTTSPKLDLENYELEKDSIGEYVIPENATGIYGEEDIEVTYYYTVKNIPLIVHHYIEGTNQPVELLNGDLAESETKYGNEGETYNTVPLTEELNEKYELVEMPENAEGTYEYSENIVNYYYRVKKFNVTTSVKPFERTDDLGQVKTIKGGTISGEGLDTYEVVEYDEDSTKEIKAVPDEGCIVGEITINDEPVEFTTEPDGSVILNKFVAMRGNKNVVVTFNSMQGQVKVNHFIEGTEERITDLDGIEVAQEIKQGDIGSGYATKPREDLYAKYELVSSPAETSGTFSDQEVTLNYYYRIKKYPYIVNYLLKDDDEDDTNNTVLHEQKADGEIYDYGTIINAENEKIEIGGYRVDLSTAQYLKIEQENNILNIYYILDDGQTKDIKYTVEFYKDNEKQELDTIKEGKTVQILDSNELEVNKEEINIINKYTGYILDKIMLNDEEITELPDTVNADDILKVYYKKDNFMYTVEYYFDDVKDEDLTEIDIADFGEIITEYTDKVKEGYRLKEEVLPLQITEDIDTNIMKVYYVTDDSQTKEISYKVEYYKEEELQVPDTIQKTETVQVLQKTLNVDKEEINTTDKYENYNFKKIMVNEKEVQEIPDTVNDKDVIKVYYEKKPSQIIIKYQDQDGNTIKGDYLVDGKLYDEFDISTLNDEIPGYIIKEKTKEGIIRFEIEKQEIVFIYEKEVQQEKGKVTVKYLEINTNNVVADEEVIEGYVGDAYKTEEKILERYSFLKVEGISEGKIAKGETEVIYYYTMIRVDQGVDEHRVDLIGKQEKEIQKETKKEVIPKVSANKPVTNNTKKQNKTSETKKLETGDVLPVAVFSIVIVLIISNTLIAIVTKEENGSRNSNKQISTRRKTLIKTKDKIKRTSRMERLSNVEPEKKVKKGRRAK